MTPNSSQGGSLVGCILLVAGSCIGAAMLGLPILSGLLGFFPSTLMLLLSWVFMVATGLLVLEVNLWFGDQVNLVTMAERTLGAWGKAAVWALFAFLFYSLMVAYVSGGGIIFSGFFSEFLGLNMSPSLCGLGVSAICGLLLYFGVHAVDVFNRWMMFGLILAYVGLLVLGVPHVESANWGHSDWSYSFTVLPAMIVSYGFHNLLPSLTRYLRGEVKPLKQAILIGSGGALLLYLFWQGLILGLVESEAVFLHSLGEGEMATQVLRSAVGASWVSDVADAFAFFAIVTSFVGVALSLRDFLADGLGVVRDRKGRFCLALLVLVPPYVMATLYPQIFLKALSYAGAFGAALLFGVLPAIMVWRGRYHLGLQGPRLLPGGKGVLIAVALAACVVVIGALT